MDTKRLNHSTNMKTRQEFNTITNSLIFLQDSGHKINIPTSLINELFTFAITEYWLKCFDIEPLRQFEKIAYSTKIKGFQTTYLQLLEQYACLRKHKEKFKKIKETFASKDDVLKRWRLAVIQQKGIFFGSKIKSFSPKLTESKNTAQARGDGAWAYS